MTEIIKDEAYWKQYRKDWYKRHKQDPEWNAKHLEYHRDWKKKAKENPEYRKDVNSKALKRHDNRMATDPEYKKTVNRYSYDRYHRDVALGRVRGNSRTLKQRCKQNGITVADYENMLEKQNGNCAICKQPEKRKVNGNITRLSIDHDHKTGEVRGLLCSACNFFIGQAFDNVETLKKAIAYLKKHE